MGADKDFCNKLIEAVKQEQGLYVKTDSRFRDTVARREAWQRVGKKLGESSEVCEHRWRLMRVRFGRVVHAKRLLGDKAPRYLTSWPFFSKLQFLKGHLQSRKKPKRRTSSETAFMLDTEDSAGDNSLGFMPLKQEAEISIEDESIRIVNAASMENREQFSASEAVEELRGVIDTFKARINEADEDEAFLKNLAVMMRPLCQRTRESLKQQMFEKVMAARAEELVD